MIGRLLFKRRLNLFDAFGGGFVLSFWEHDHVLAAAVAMIAFATASIAAEKRWAKP